MLLDTVRTLLHTWVGPVVVIAPGVRCGPAESAGKSGMRKWSRPAKKPKFSSTGLQPVVFGLYGFSLGLDLRAPADT